MAVQEKVCRAIFGASGPMEAALCEINDDLTAILMAGDGEGRGTRGRK